MNSANNKQKIISVKAKPPYLLYAELQNHETIVLDLTSLIEKRSAFWRLKNFKYFQQVSIDPLGGLYWQCEEDIAPCKIFDYVVEYNN